MTKWFYKDLVNTIKDNESNKIIIKSIPIQILDVEKYDSYKNKLHPQNFF